MDAILQDDPISIFDRIMFCRDNKFEVCAPAVVETVFNNGTALVKPLTKLVDVYGNEKVCREILVTIRTENHGGFFVSHPIMPGDTGWIIAADRDTTLVKQYNSQSIPSENDGPQPPNKNKNLHQHSFGFFIPDRWITVAEELIKSLKYPESKDKKVLCGGDYVIGSERNAAGNLDGSNEFGVVRDDKGNDVPYTIDDEGHTKSLDGKYKGKYFWSRFVLLASGACDIFGQGTKFSIRTDGLYLNDKLFIDAHGNLINAVRSVTGDTKDSVTIKGDIDIVGAKNSGIKVKTEIPVDKDGNPMKPRVVIDTDGRGSGGGMNLISGDDSRIIFTPITSGYNAGKTKIDVYYV